MPFGWFKLDLGQLPVDRLSGGAIKVFLVLASIMDEEQHARCSYASLCQSLHISKRTAYRAIDELCSYDLVYRTNAPNATLSVTVKAGATVGRGKSPGDLPMAYRQEFSKPGGAISGTNTP
jgi:hypothetical protein